jgi:putative transposase
MPEYLRWKSTGATYFFTVVTQRRRPLFGHPVHRRFLGASFREAGKTLPFAVDAIVLLPDHLHVVMRPEEGVDYSKVWRLIKTTFTRRVHLDAPVAQTNELVHRDAPISQTDKLGHRDAPYMFGAGRRKGEADVWQRRFYEHTIRDEGDWGRHIDYIHWNPVKHGYVTRPQAWRWSSIHRYIGRGLRVSDWPAGQELELPDVPE